MFQAEAVPGVSLQSFAPPAGPPALSDLFPSRALIRCLSPLRMRKAADWCLKVYLLADGFTAPGGCYTAARRNCSPGIRTSEVFPFSALNPRWRAILSAA
jgi:hypothetical protein